MTDSETEICKGYGAEGSRTGKKYGTRLWDECETLKTRGEMWTWWYILALIPLNRNGNPDLPLGSGNYRCGNYRCGGEWHTDPALDRKIEPYNLSTTTPLVINQDTNLVDLTKKANPCPHNEEHKQEQERKQPNCRWMINLKKLGSHKLMNGKTILDRII